MAIYHPPIPPVFTGGAQPYSPRKWFTEGLDTNDPPFRYAGPYALISEYAMLAQPNPWVYAFMGRGQPFERRKLPIVVVDVAVNDPPFQSRERTRQAIANAVSQSQPDPWTYSFFGGLQPFEPSKLSPGIPGQSSDRPPFEHRGRTVVRMAQIVAMAQPNPWVYAIAWRQPYDARRLPPSIIAVPENNPPFGMRFRVTLATMAVKSWEPPPPLPWHMHGMFRVNLARAKGYILG